MLNKPFCPDFLMIGGPQSGSTWLHVNLKEHPQICMPQPKKELHYFDNHFALGYDWYKNFYLEKRDQITGEICPSYGILSDEKIQIIKAINPDVKLIYIVRNPVDMEISLLNRIANQKKNAYKLNDPAEVRKMLFTQYRKGDYAKGLKMVDHDKILPHWLKYFDKQSFHICFYEDIKKAPVLLLNHIFKFLDLNPSLCTKSAIVKYNTNAKHVETRKWLAEIEAYLKPARKKTKEILLEEFNIEANHINWLNS